MYVSNIMMNEKANELQNSVRTYIVCKSCEQTPHKKKVRTILMNQTIKLSVAVYIFRCRSVCEILRIMVFT